MVSANYLHDLLIEAGHSLSEPNFDTTSYMMCAEVPGAVEAGATVRLKCAPGTMGRFVVVRIEGENEALTMCEVQVYGVLSTLHVLPSMAITFARIVLYNESFIVNI